MRFSLRALLIAMLLLGPLCAWGWTSYRSWREERMRVAELRRQLLVFTANRGVISADRDKLAKQLIFRSGPVPKVREVAAPEEP